MNELIKTIDIAQSTIRSMNLTSSSQRSDGLSYSSILALFSPRRSINKSLISKRRRYVDVNQSCLPIWKIIAEENDEQSLCGSREAKDTIRFSSILKEEGFFSRLNRLTNENFIRFLVRVQSIFVCSFICRH